MLHQVFEVTPVIEKVASAGSAGSLGNLQAALDEKPDGVYLNGGLGTIHRRIIANESRRYPGGRDGGADVLEFRRGEPGVEKRWESLGS